MCNDDILEKFQGVCPDCTAIFDLDEAVVEKGWDDERAEEFLQITCPICGYNYSKIKLADG